MNFCFQGRGDRTNEFALKTAQRNACYYKPVLSNNTSGAMIPTSGPGNPAQRLNISLSPEERTMNATEVAQNNFNSWNRHDADAINAAYAEPYPVGRPFRITMQTIRFVDTIATTFPRSAIR
jgi:hypothetical protein